VIDAGTAAVVLESACYQFVDVAQPRERGE
jgi:hypothetical protein